MACHNYMSYLHQDGGGSLGVDANQYENPKIWANHGVGFRLPAFPTSLQKLKRRFKF